MAGKLKYDIVGKVYPSNSCGDLEVIKRQDNRDVCGNRLYLVRFHETGNEASFPSTRIRLGKVKDVFYPSVYGVGYLGEATRSGNETEYHRWADMLRRCYDSSCSRYVDYGGRGIEVCSRWHSFYNYLEDIVTLDGYEDPDRCTMDRVDNSQGYFPENCRWASVKTQNRNQRRRKDQRTFLAYPPGAEKPIKACSQRGFAREHGLLATGISNCLHGRANTHQGWSFVWKTKEGQ